MPSATTVSEIASIETECSSFYRIILAASIGNALEWFDILVYGFFATTIAKTFFPAANATMSLLLTLGTYGISYLVRP
ncbi:MAG TPA: MFS transporter, partial [Paraburkholderia sp.]